MLVLFVLAGLAVLAVEFSRDVLLDHALSSSTRSILASKPLMESGERLAAAVLIRNNLAGNPDHHREDWGRFDTGLQRLSDELVGSTLSGSIEDENSFFPINAVFYARESERARAEAFAAMLTRLLAGLMRLHGYEGGADNAVKLAAGFVDALRQWGGQKGTDAEALRWYLTREPRRLPPKRPLMAPEEILLIHWPYVDEAWGHEVLHGSPERPGLLDLITVWAPGPMNINTLRPELLAALVQDERQALPFAGAVERYRANPDNELNAGWYKELFSYYDVPALPQGVIDVQSRWYRLHLAVRQGARENRLTSVGWVTNQMVTWEYRVIR